MEQRLMHIVSNIGKHILGTLQKAFRRIFVAFILVFLIVAVATEAASVFLSGKFPPDGTTHLAAAALAIAFGYAVAITIAIEEILRGIVKSIELIVQETEKLAGEAIGEVERLFDLQTDSRDIVLDLKDVSLVDRDVMSFLARCEADGVSLENCPPYIREWIRREKD